MRGEGVDEHYLGYELDVIDICHEMKAFYQTSTVTPHGKEFFFHMEKRLFGDVATRNLKLHHALESRSRKPHSTFISVFNFI